MDKLMRAGRALFALSMIGLGVEHFIYGEFVTGRAPPWPSTLPGEVIWAYVSGLVVVLAGVAILFEKNGRIAATILGALIFAWALLRHIPVVVASEVLAPDWTKAVKALAFTGGALAIAATFPKLRLAADSRLSQLLNSDAAFVAIATICLAIFMINNGSQHFIYTEFVASLIPAWFPGDGVFWAYFSAMALFAGAAGMLFPPTARLAALLTGVMVFAWVWIVHVPRVFVSVSDNIALFEAPAIAAIAFVLAAHKRETARSANPLTQTTPVG